MIVRWDEQVDWDVREDPERAHNLVEPRSEEEDITIRERGNELPSEKVRTLEAVAEVHPPPRSRRVDTPQPRMYIQQIFLSLTCRLMLASSLERKSEPYIGRKEIEIPRGSPCSSYCGYEFPSKRTSDNSGQRANVESCSAAGQLF